MPRATLRLGLTLLALAACAHPRAGDVHEGPCRVDADCPAGERCSESRGGHLRSVRSGEIVGELLTHVCEAPKPASATTTAPACCASPDEIDRLAGERVRLVGVYQAMAIAQRAEAKPDLSRAGASGVLSESGQIVILGVYHRADGVRSIEERQRHDGKRVEVVGILERRTPGSVAPDGQVEATMINPYVYSIESIRVLDPAESAAD